ncbi:MAG: dockerin type I repeat-containing protein, partial [Clostridia bacterium]|nr:dockerin type I repeat-containing protein [Clostridia bacterium]
IEVDTAVPDAPEFNVTEGEKPGSVNVTGSAPGAQLVMITFENDYDIEDDEGNPDTYTSTTIAAILNPVDDGSFSVIVPKPTVDSRIKAVAINATGGMSSGAAVEISGYGETLEESTKYADSFTSIDATPVDGKRDVTVTVYGTQITGLTVNGDILYRVVDSAPSSEYPANGEFDTTGWISAGAVSDFTVKNVQNGQYVEVVQVASENIYETDESGNLTVTGVKYTVLRHGSVAVDNVDVSGYTVSGNLIPDSAKTNVSGAILVLTDSADSFVTYTANVTVTDGIASYAFTDIIPGTYVLSLDKSIWKFEADDVLITVNNADVTKDISIRRTAFDVTGTLTCSDARVNMSTATVTLLDAGGNEIAQATVSASSGNSADYSFSDMAAGNYTVRISGVNIRTDDVQISVSDDVVSDIEAVSTRVPGDINGDGQLNNKDITRLFQYLSDWDVTVNEAALDVNGDGLVNNKDLSRLFQYLSDWDVVIY